MTGARVEIREVAKTFRGSHGRAGRAGRARGRGDRGGDIQALTPIKLDIAGGEFVAIVGPSGCGKSTLLSIVAGLDTPTEGEVRIDGEPVRGPNPRLGIAFQKDMLLDWRTVLANVLLQVEVRGLDRNAYRQRALDLLDRVGLTDFVDRYPDALSGGMRQRVSVVRSLLHDPPLLLMDEPFAALDLLTRDQMALDFQRLCVDQGKTILFVTHSVSEAVFLADRVVVFTPRPGRIAEVCEIDLPRPRRLADRAMPAFAGYEAHIRGVLESYGILREAPA